MHGIMHLAKGLALLVLCFLFVTLRSHLLRYFFLYFFVASHALISDTLSIFVQAPSVLCVTSTSADVVVSICASCSVGVSTSAISNPKLMSTLKKIIS